MADQQEQQQEPQSDQDMIQVIVEQVNHILGKTYSLVEFDELPPVTLLQVVSDIFGQLTPNAQIDFGTTPLDVGAMELMKFLLRTLGYKVPPLVQHNFQGDFTMGEKTVVYPMLYWVLRRMPENHKRVYLAKYLERVDIPEDLKMQDDGIRDLWQRYDALRSDFIQVHKRVDALKEANADPTEARRKIANLESERDQLVQSITVAQKKLAAVSNRDALLSACKSLRAEQDDEHKLTQKKEEQQRALVDAQRRANEANTRLRDVRRDIQDNRLEAVIQRMQDDQRANRMKLDQQLPQELNEKRQRVAALQNLATESVDMSSLMSDAAQLDREVQQLQAQVAERNRPGDDGTDIVMMKQQVQRVVKKKNDMLGELNGLQQENQFLQQQQRDKEQSLEQFRSSKILKGDDFRRFANQVRQKTEAVHNMKRRLADLRGEFGVLQYTEKLLRENQEDLQGDLSELEAKLGARGYVQQSEQLARVTDEKASVEQVKAATLKDLAAVVQNLVKDIAQRRDHLAPRIVQLREMRNQATVLEQEWEEKRSAYEYQQGSLMQEINKLDNEVRGLSEETRLSESLYHQTHSRLEILKIQQTRIDDEKEFRAGSKQLSATARSYTQLFHSSTENLEQKTKLLQKRRRDIDDNHESRLQQVEYFSNLKRILEAKVASLRREDGAQGATSIDADIQQIMNSTSTQGNVNMLVLGNN